MNAKEGEVHQRFFHILPAMMATVGFDGLFVEANPAWESDLGYPPASLAGTPCLDLVHPDDRAEVSERQRKAVSGEAHSPFEVRFLCRDGTVKWLHLRCAGDPEKRLLYLAATDITPRKLTEEALRDSEATLRRIVDKAPMAMAIVNIAGTIEYVNQKAVEVFGYPHSEIPDMDHWWVLAYPDEAYRKEVIERWMGRVLAAWEKKSEIDGGEYLVTCRNGAKKTCYIFGVIAADKVFVMFDDITRRVDAETALRASESSLRSVLETAPVAIGLRDLETGDLDYINEAFTATFGYTREDILTFGDWIRRALPTGPRSDEWKEDWKRLTATLKAGNGVFPTGEYEITCKDGSVKTAVLRGVTTPDGKVLGIFEDITARAQTLRNLRDSETMLRRILELAPIGIMISRVDGPVEFLNRKQIDSFGYTMEDVRDHRDLLRLAYPDEKYRREVEAAWKADVEKSLKSGGEMEGREYQIRCKNGERKTIYSSGVVMPDKRVIILSEDVTARRETERALRESESLYRALVETTRTGYVVIDGQGKVRDANKEYVRLSGHSDLKEIIGRSVLEWAAPHSRKRAWEAVEIVVRDGRLENFELDYVDKAGKITRVEINATVVSRDGVPQILGLLRDVTARSKTEAHLRDSEALYRALVETTRTGYVVIDDQGKVTDANREYVRLTGHSDLKEIVGRRVTEWTAPDLVEENAAAVARCARDGHIFNYETDYLGPNGKRTPIEINATVVRRAGVAQIHTLCRDISERRRQGAELKALNQGLEKRVSERTAELSAANMELTMEIAQRIDAERAREKLQSELLQSQKMEVVGRLAGGIAHDFNNILVAISGYAEFLLKGVPEGSQTHEDLCEILRETERGSLLTRQLITLSRRQPLVLKVLSVNSVVEDACRMLRRLVGANVHLVTSLSPDLAPVKADAGQVAQVILNLVINARDAMPDGGTITLATANEEVTAAQPGGPLPPKPGSYAVLTVTDTGAGVAPEIAEKIFEPFFTTKPEGKGTGLGLSTVCGIVQQAQGGLLLSSTPGKGASFKIYFPRTADKA